MRDSSSSSGNQVDNQAYFFIVAAAEVALRLDQFLIKKFPQTGRAYWRGEQLKKISINGKPAKKGQVLAVGDRIQLQEIPSFPRYFIQKNSSIKIQVIYQDKYLLIVNKPAGIATHPLQAEETNTLLNGIVAEFPEQWEWGKISREAGLIHRLDTGTSGLLVLAQNAEAQQQLKSLQKAGGIEKTYLAWVEGELSGQGEIRQPIAHHPHNRKKMFLPSEIQRKKYAARDAVTQYRIKELFLSTDASQIYTLVELKIHQGRRHQIRVHLAGLGHPIVGDTLYGARSFENYRGHLLHANKVEFLHPVSQSLLKVEVPVPAGFKP